MKPGDDEHIKGFIMNKVYSFRAWVKPGGRPHRHHSTINLQKGYPKHHRGKFNNLIKELNRNRLIHLFPHHGNGLHASALLSKQAVSEGIRLANGFRVSVGLPPWDESFREILDEFSSW